MDWAINFYRKIIGIGSTLQHILLLAIRIYWGIAFFQAGWGKLSNIGAVASFFGDLGIPFPTFNAYLVGYVEMIGGLCLLAGFASRLAAIPLIFTMTVALITAHTLSTMEMLKALLQINGGIDMFLVKADKFVKEAPFNYLMASLIVFCFGPGKISIDFILEKIFTKTKR